jgi:hypothetical protein
MEITYINSIIPKGKRCMNSLNQFIMNKKFGSDEKQRITTKDYVWPDASSSN